MLNQSSILQLLKSKKEFLHQQFGVKNMALFGSFANGNATELSDVDLLIEFDEQAKDIFTLKMQLKDYLQNEMGRAVDLANPKYLKPYVKSKILQSALYA